MSGLGEYACYKLSYYMLSHKKFGRYSELVKVSTDVTEFEEWRANGSPNIVLSTVLVTTCATPVEFSNIS